MMRFIITRMIQPILNSQKFLLCILLLSSIVLSQEPEDSLALDWDDVEWVEIVDIPKTIVFEIDNITATAGVRGTEAEDEILQYLYYRRKATREEI